MIVLVSRRCRLEPKPGATGVAELATVALVLEAGPALTPAWPSLPRNFLLLRFRPLLIVVSVLFSWLAVSATIPVLYR